MEKRTSDLMGSVKEDMNSVRMSQVDTQVQNG